MRSTTVFISALVSTALFFTGAGAAFAEDPIPPAPTPAPVSAFPLATDSTGAQVQLLQQRLVWLGYGITQGERDSSTFGDSTRKAVQEVQEKFLRAATGQVSEKFFGFIKDTASPLRKLPKACRKGIVICIDKKQKLLRWVKGGKVKVVTDARFGIPGEETADGMHRITRKEKHNISDEYQTPMPFSMFFYGNQAIHFSYWFRRDGYYGGSHGCVNIRDWQKMKWIYAHSPMGTRVFVYRS